MGIDSKEFQAFMWKVFKISMNTCSTFVQTYPLPSGVSLSLLVLYLFLPSVFYFLIYSVAFLGCTAVFIRYYLNSQPPKIQHGVDERKEYGISSAKSAVDNRGDNSSIEGRRMSQRNINKDNEESDAHDVKEEGKMVPSMLSNDDFIGRTALVEEKPKVFMEENASSPLNRGESSSYNVSIFENISEMGAASNPDAVSFNGFNEQAAKLQVGGDVESESSSSEADDDEEEESDRKGGENAVEWTEYDQKNLMDLGDSELERNRRLESLIARRRARKSFKMGSSAAPGRGTMHPVLVARTNTFRVSKSSDDPLPGSAPSIFLATRNPFDLPYDPFEEKPNLMADSFQKEFMADHMQELHLCRHESFSWGNSPQQESTKDQHQGTGYSRSKLQLEKENRDQQVNHLLFQGVKILRRNISVTDLVTEEDQSPNQVITSKRERDGEVGTSRIQLEGEKMGQSQDKDPRLGDIGSDTQMGTDAIKNKKIRPSPSSSVEELLNAKTAEKSESQRPTTFKFPDVFYNRAPNSLTCPVPKVRAIAEPQYDSSPSAIHDNTRLMEDHFFYKHKVPAHTPTNSVASDMQVEVSEIGSPPLTIDGTASSNDGDSLIYDGDSEKEITSGSEEMWGSSPLAPKVQENDNAPGQIYEAGFEDFTEEGYSRVRNEPEDPMASTIWSLTSSRAEISQEDQAHSMNIHPKNSNDVKHVEDEGKQMPSNSSDAVPPDHSLKGMGLMEDSLGHTPSEMYFQKQQEPLDAHGNSAEEMNINICNADDTVTYNDREDLKSNEDRYIGAENSMMREVVANLSEAAEGSNSKSNSNIKSESLIDLEKPVQGVDNTYNAYDSRFLINDQLEDVKLNKERDSGAEKAKQVVIADLSQPVVERNSEFRKHIESKSLNSLEKSGEEANVTCNVNDPLVHIKDPLEHLESIERIDQDSERLTEHSDIQNILMAVEGEDNPTSIQGNREYQNTIEVGVSGVNPSFPTTSAILPELVVDQVSTNSSLSSSPKSVLAYRMPADVASSSDFSQLLSNDMEENLPLPATQDTSHVMNVSTDHPSIDSQSEKSEYTGTCESPFSEVSEIDAPCIEQEPSNSQGKSTEQAIEMENLKGSLLDDEETKENLKYRKNIDDESEASISNEASAELWKPLEEISPRSVEHLAGASARLADNKTNIDISKPEGEHSTSMVPGLVVEEEESANPTRYTAAEVNVTSHVCDPSTNKENVENLRSSEGNEGEPVKRADITYLEGHDCSPGVLTEIETIVVSSRAIDADNSSTCKDTDEFGKQIADKEIKGFLRPAEAIGISVTTKDIQGDPKDLTYQKAVLDPSKPAVDGDNTLVTLEAEDSAADINHDVNESVTNEIISKDQHLQDINEDESQRLDRQEDIMVPPKAAEVTNSESIRVIESESNQSAVGEVNAIPSQLADEIRSSNNRENTEDPGKSIIHGNVMNISEHSKGDDIVRTVEDIKRKI